MFTQSLPPVTAEEAAAFPSRHKSTPAAQALYQEHEYLDAYAQHTDLRVQENGPAAAIGGDWEAGGQRQLAFLQAQGVTPQTRVLDFGCGTGRLARVLVPYLAPNHYTGIDLSLHALVALQELAWQEDWEQQGMTLHCGDGTLACVAGERHDVVWCYSVFIHLPPVVLEAIIASLPAVTFDRLFFSFKPAATPRRTSYKQFACPLDWYQQAAHRYGYRVVRPGCQAASAPAAGAVTPDQLLEQRRTADGPCTMAHPAPTTPARSRVYRGGAARPETALHGGTAAGGPGAAAR